jgi:D-beta-D-heptose 7-phosphate kinase/D-beta-D-heptose 1-phosphate adenosyltransferase
MKQFLTFGESCEDVFIYGKVKRLSPEAPVPVFIPTKTVKSKGMSVNVSNNISKIGFLMYQKTKIEFTVNSKFSVNENIKTRYVDEKSNHYFLRVDEGDETHSQLHLTESYIQSIKTASCIVISDYNKGFISETDIIVINNTRNYDSLLIMDTKRLVTPKILTVVDYFKMNESEYDANVNNLGKDVMDRYAEKIIITKGERGATHNNIDYIGKSHTARDVSGAGDTFLAAIAVSLTYGLTIKEAIIEANDFASQVVLKKGVSTI